MAIEKRMNSRLGFAFFIAFIFFFSGGLRAQIQPIDSLRGAITIKEDSLKQLDKMQKRIKQSFDALNTEIFRQKKELETSSNPLIRLSLNGNLKASARLAAKLEKLQKQKLRIQRELLNAYRRVIAVIDSLVREKLPVVHHQQNSRIQIAALNMISLLEKEKKVWQKKLAEMGPTETQKPLLEIEPGDTIERLQLKIQLLQDRIRQVDGDLKKLRKRRTGLQSDLQIYQEMLGFMDNLQQNIDPEQEYFDQERSDQLKDDVRNAKLKISGIDERLGQLSAQKEELENKLTQFKAYLKNMLKQ